MSKKGVNQRRRSDTYTKTNFSEIRRGGRGTQGVILSVSEERFSEKDLDGIIIRIRRYLESLGVVKKQVQRLINSVTSNFKNFINHVREEYNGVVLINFDISRGQFHTNGCFA